MQLHGGFIGAKASISQEKYHKKLKNRTLITTAMILSVSCIISGVCGLFARKYIGFLVAIISMYLVYYFCEGMYAIIIDKYLSSFANHKIDTKIFATNNLIKNLIQAVGILFASFLLDKMATAYCMIIMGSIFTFIYWMTGKYMKTRVGLRPEEYSKEEIKYDEQKLVEKLKNGKRKNKV